MITLKTGVPGASKTLHAVAELAKLLDSWRSSAESARRPVYVFGIADLELPHFDLPVYPLSGRPGDPYKRTPRGRPAEPLAVDWQSVPEEALCIIDEAQYVFPPRSSTSKKPDHVNYLHEHRHDGGDIWVITQHPKMLDADLRRLVGKHQHYRRVFGGQRSICYEWDHCEDSLNSIKTAVKKIQSFPRDAFKYYKSAEVHTKQSFSVPSWLYLFPVAVLVLLGYGGTKLAGMMQGKSAALAAIAPASAPSGPGGEAPAVPGAAGLLPVAAAPEPRRIAGCIMIKARCECIDSAGISTPVDYDMCRASSQRSGLLVAYDMAPTSSGPVSRPAEAALAASDHGAPPVGISTSYSPRNPVRDLSGTLSGLGTPSAPAHDLDGSILASMRGAR